MFSIAWSLFVERLGPLSNFGPHPECKFRQNHRGHESGHRTLECIQLSLSIQVHQPCAMRLPNAADPPGGDRGCSQA